MSKFADALMLKYMATTQLDALLLPPSDPNRLRIRQLLQNVYEMRFLTVRDVEDVKVLSKHYQVELPHLADVRASLERILPDSQRSFATATAPLARSDWMGMELETRISVKVELTAGALQRVETEDLSDVSSIADLQSRFQFVDVPLLMTTAGVSTLDELRAVFPHQVRMLFAQPPAYDPNDPAARRAYRLTICALFLPTLEVEEALRQVKLCRRLAVALRPHVDAVDGVEVRAPGAWMAIFPSATLTPAGPSEAAVRSVFAAEGIVAAFEDVP